MARAPAVQEIEELPEADRLDGFPHPRATPNLYGHETAERALATAFASGRIDTQDGVRADVELPGGGAGWVHARPSNTEPIFRLIAEAPTRAQAVELLDTAQRAITA